MCYPRGDIDFIKDRLEVAHVGENSIRNRDGTFEGLEIL